MHLWLFYHKIFIPDWTKYHCQNVLFILLLAFKALLTDVLKPTAMTSLTPLRLKINKYVRSQTESSYFSNRNRLYLPPAQLQLQLQLMLLRVTRTGLKFQQIVERKKLMTSLLKKIFRFYDFSNVMLFTHSMLL